MTPSEGAVENSKYKLLGFENDKRLAVIMVIATGKVLKIKLSEVLSSEMMDNFNKMEIKNLYKKFYSQGGTLTAYDINDRNENSWMIYIILNLLLFTFSPHLLWRVRENRKSDIEIQRYRAVVRAIERMKVRKSEIYIDRKKERERPKFTCLIK